MLIKHMPSGLFPHFDCGYQRIPCYPEVGEEVYISCRLEGGTPDTRVYLQYSINDIAMPSVIGQLFQKENDDRLYYHFNLGKFEDVDLVEYVISAKEKSSTINTKPYLFAVTQKIKLSSPTRIIQDGEKILAEYHCNEIKPVLEISFTEGLKMRLLSHLNVSANAIDFVAFEKNIGKEYSVAFTTSPFKMQIFKENELIGGLDESSMNLTVNINKHNQISKVNYNVVTNSSCFYGFGEKFDKVNQINLSPLSYVVEQYSNQQDKTYLPIPFFYTEKGFGFYRNTYDKLQFRIHGKDNTNNVIIALESVCPKGEVLIEDYFLVGKPIEIIKQYHLLSGAPIMPPKWVFGPWISANGWNTQKEALEQLRYMETLSIPATVMVLEAWSDEENFYIINDAKYTPNDGSEAFRYEDFSFSQEGKWPNPRKFIGQLKENNIKLILWQIPVIKKEHQNHGIQLDHDEAYAIEHNLCIMNEDGTPYRVTDNWFHNSLMPDFTNPQTVSWWFKKREYLLQQLDVAGFKTDGGEFLFDDTAKFYNGKSGAQMHNQYPNLYEGAYHEFLNRCLGENKGVTFSRAGYSGAQKYPIHWAGDQISTFSELKGQLTAGLSIGLSGVPFWSFDIGGFAGEFPSTELYLRSVALGAFVPIMQFHSEPRSGQYYMTDRDHWNNDRSPWNLSEVHNDRKIISEYRRFANLRMNLIPYLYNEGTYCVENARPLMAHLIVDYVEDEAVYNIEDEYILGRNMLVAPLIKEGCSSREIYLPKGKWYDFFTGELYDGEQVIEYSCELERIPVFCKEGTCLPLHINRKLIMGTNTEDSSISNSMQEYENFCLFCYRDCDLQFADDCGNKISASLRSDCMYINIESTMPNIIVTMAVGDLPKKIIVNGNEIKEPEPVRFYATNRMLLACRIPLQ